jgi:hypothetical protein
MEEQTAEGLRKEFEVERHVDWIFESQPRFAYVYWLEQKLLSQFSARGMNEDQIRELAKKFLSLRILSKGARIEGDKVIHSTTDGENNANREIDWISELIVGFQSRLLSLSGVKAEPVADKTATRDELIKFKRFLEKKKFKYMSDIDFAITEFLSSQKGEQEEKKPAGGMKKDVNTL